MNWYLKVMREYFDFNGRARRKEYWMFLLLYILLSFALAFVITLVLGERFANGIFGLWMLAHFIPGIMVGIRRMHDIGRSGWWLLISLVPVVGWIIALYWTVKEGDRGSNAYGPDPKAAD